MISFSTDFKCQLYHILHLLSVSICGFLFHLTIDLSFNVSVLERISCFSNQEVLQQHYQTNLGSGHPHSVKPGCEEGECRVHPRTRSQKEGQLVLQRPDLPAGLARRRVLKGQRKEGG